MSDYEAMGVASDNAKHSNTRHGHWKNGRASRTYQSWMHAKDRCYNPESNRYHRYGARGIKMCQSWLSSFKAFLADMGEAPDGKTLDRIDNDGDYEPGNCRWATRAEQGQKTSLTKIDLVIAGQIRARRQCGLSLRQLAEEFSVSKSIVHRVVSGKTWRPQE